MLHASEEEHASFATLRIVHAPFRKMKTSEVGNSVEDAKMKRLATLKHLAVLVFLSSAAIPIFLFLKNFDSLERKKNSLALEIFMNQSRALHFRPNELEILIRMIKDFDAVTTAHNISYFLWGGTLLGAYRNGSILPWDDDFDLVMNANYTRLIDKQIKKKGPYSTHQWGQNLFKIYSKTLYTHKSGRRPWNWPFLDVWLYFDEGSHLKLYEMNYSSSIFFPTKIINFHGLELPVPNNVTATISLFYGESALSECQSNYYSHRDEEYWPTKAIVDCKELESVFNMSTPEELREEASDGAESGDNAAEGQEATSGS